MADENIIFRHHPCFKFISNKFKPQMLNYSLIQKMKEGKKNCYFISFDSN